MSKSAKELYTVPDWMRPYLPLFHNTGGNDVEELLYDDNTSMFANSIRYMLIVSVRSQFTLLMDLHQRGFLSAVSDAFLAEVRAQAIISALESLDGVFDTDCVMESNGISYEAAEQRTAGALAVNRALANVAFQLRKGVQS